MSKEIAVNNILKDYKLGSVENLNPWCQKPNRYLKEGEYCTLNKKFQSDCTTTIGKSTNKERIIYDKGTIFRNFGGNIKIEPISSNSSKSSFGSMSSSYMCCILFIVIIIFFIILKKKKNVSAPVAVTQAVKAAFGIRR